MELSVSFYPKNQTKGSDKPIYIKVNKKGINPIRKFTGRRINQRGWSTSGGTPKNNKQNWELNQFLDTITKELKDWYYSLDSPEDATRSKIKEKVDGILTGEPTSNTEKGLFHHFEDFIEYQKGWNYRKKTIDRYRTTYSYFKEFAPEASFADLDSDMYERFIKWLAHTKGIINKTINKHIRSLSSFLNHCYNKNITNRDLSKNFKQLPEAEQGIVNLSEEEFSKLEEADFSDEPNLERAKDVFLFACYSGVRYADLDDIRKHHIVNTVMDFPAVKTGTHYRAGLPERAIQILEKYGYQLPVDTNQSLNRLLKRMAYRMNFDRMVQLHYMVLRERVDYEKPLYEVISSHSGRKTYVTDRARAGVNRDLVEASAGFKSGSTSFNRYIGFVDEDLKNAARQTGRKKEGE